jgi:hypothetical protein
MGITFSPLIIRSILCLISDGLNGGIYELNPVPIPSVPFTKTVGKIGT